MATEKPIKAVIFDMDGLLLDTETLALEAMVAGGEVLGYEVSDELCQQVIGVPADRVRTMLHEVYGEDFPVDRFFEEQEKTLHEMVETGRLQTKAGGIKMLDLLDEFNIPRGIATSSSRYRADRHLEKAGILDRFNVVVSRDDVSRGKPNPDPYLSAASKLGVNPEYCLALEDSYNGIRAAHAAQIRVIMVPDLLPATDEMRSIALNVIKSLDEVISWLRPILEQQAGQ